MLQRLREIFAAIMARRWLVITLQLVFLIALGAVPRARAPLDLARRAAAAAPRAPPGPGRRRGRDRGLLPRLRPRLAGDPAPVRRAAAVSRGPARRDAEPAREVRPGRRLDAGGPRRRGSPLRDHRHDARADVDRARGGTLRDLGRARAARRPAARGPGLRDDLARRAVRCTARRARAPADLRDLVATSRAHLRRGRARHPSSRCARPSRCSLLLRHLGARGRRPLVHRPLGRRPARQVDPVPGRRLRRRCDRGGAGRVRAVRSRSARGVDVRPDPRRRAPGRRARRGRAEPPRDHRSSRACCWPSRQPGRTGSGRRRSRPTPSPSPRGERGPRSVPARAGRAGATAHGARPVGARGAARGARPLAQVARAPRARDRRRPARDAAAHLPRLRRRDDLGAAAAARRQIATVRGRRRVGAGAPDEPAQPAHRDGADRRRERRR